MTSHAHTEYNVLQIVEFIKKHGVQVQGSNGSTYVFLPRWLEVHRSGQVFSYPLNFEPPQELKTAVLEKLNQ